MVLNAEPGGGFRIYKSKIRNFNDFSFTLSIINLVKYHQYQLTLL
jgi:hypothetical protein